MANQINKSPNERLEVSRKATEDYLAYIVRQGEERKAEWNGITLSLDSVMEEVRRSGTVTALAAHDALEAHNSTLMLLTSMTKAQGKLAALVADIKISGGGGRGGSRASNIVDGAMMGWEAGKEPKTKAALAAIGAVVGSLSLSQTDAEFTKWYEEQRPYSVTNQALDAIRESERLAAELSGTPYEEPSNDPPFTEWFMSNDGLPPNLPIPTTSREAATLLEEINASRSAAAAKKGKTENYSAAVEYDNSSEYNNLMRHYGVEPDETTYSPQRTEAASGVDLSRQAVTLQPQSTVNNASYDNSKREINVYVTADVSGPLSHIMGDVLGSPIASTWLDTLGRALAEQINDKLNSSGTLYSNNW